VKGISGKTLLFDDAGQTLVESALSLWVTISVVFWLFEFCMFTYTCNVLNSAAQQGVRYAIVHGTDSSVCSGPDSACTDQSPYANVKAVVASAASASLHNTTGMTVTINYVNGTASPGNPVTIQLAYTYVPYIKLPGIANSVTLSSRGNILF
jgi:Flp pilus assembly protein TadG